MSFKITGEAYGLVDNKRFYLPGVQASDNCPNCGDEAVWKGSIDFVRYPLMNKPFSFHMYCHECDTEWNEQVILEVKLKKAPDDG